MESSVNISKQTAEQMYTQVKSLTSKVEELNKNRTEKYEEAQKEIGRLKQIIGDEKED